jgi:hypothetical protein
MRHWPLGVLVTQAALLFAALLPWVSHAQGASYTFGPSNYYPPAGSTPTTNVIRGAPWIIDDVHALLVDSTPQETLLPSVIRLQGPCHSSL